jgi:hypothetical protein
MSFDFKSGRIRIDSDRVRLIWFFLKNQIRLDLNLDKSEEFFGLDQVLSALDLEFWSYENSKQPSI